MLRSWRLYYFFFFLGDPTSIRDVITAWQTRRYMAWEELTIHKIIARSAFPLHWDPSMHTPTQEDPLLYVRQGLPCPPLSQSRGLKRLMSTTLVPSILWQDGCHLTTRQLPLWKPVYSLESSPTVSQYTHNSYLTLFPSEPPLPTEAYKRSKLSSTFSHCAALKGKLAGDVEGEKSFVCLNMPLKNVRGQPVKWEARRALLHTQRQWSCSVQAAAVNWGITVSQASPKAS